MAAMNAAAAFLETFERAGDALAFVEHHGQETSYRQLLRQVRALAAVLSRRGLAPGDRVVLQLPSGPVLSAGILAVIALGGVPVLADPGLGDAVYTGRIEAAAPRFVLVHPMVEAVGRLPAVRRQLEARRDLSLPPAVGGPGVKPIRLARSWLRLGARTPLGGRYVTPVPVAPEADGVIVFTGGTTKEPKGVRLSHGALSAYMAGVARVAEDVPFERFLADTPQQALYGLSMGKTVLTTPARKPRRAPFSLALLRRGAAHAYFGAPWIWQEMMASARGERLPAGVRAVFLGGAPVTRPFLERLHAFLPADAVVRVLYGLTEAGPVASVDAAEKLAWPTADGDLVGRPLPGVELALAEPDERGVGEVLVRSPSLFGGYLGAPARPPGDALRTGDLGRLVLDAVGEPRLALVGRVKDMIIRNSVNIYPPSFEPTIEALTAPDGRPWVRRAAMVGAWNDARADEDVVLCVEPEPGFDEAAFGAAVAEAVGADAAPDRTLVVEAWPVVGRLNKVDKGALRRLAEGGTGA
ncbi:MAG: acyl--CoA ligase [Deltaproteobacteria bacterium]|nr:acyl--CoA ligase [Deltaproteobacteria bacterium]